MSGIPSKPIDLSLYQTEQLVEMLAKIGSTPLLRLEPRGRTGGQLALKLEGANPGGSSKDRVASTLVRDLSDRGLIEQGDVIVDSTSGNFGVSMAWVCRALGYTFHAVTDPKATERNVKYMRALGARIDIVQQRDGTGGYLLTRMHRARQILVDGEAAVLSDQYTNPANPRSHFATTGPELFEQCPIPPDAVFVASSTGGTLVGISRFLKPRWSETRFVAVDGEGSVLFGGQPGKRSINGLGSSHKSAFITPDCYDEVLSVDANSARGVSSAMRTEHNVWIGPSGGAVVAAAEVWLAANPRARLAVCVCADHAAVY